jgi:soluble lytic murein transglycosylase-like protein
VAQSIPQRAVRTRRRRRRPRRLLLAGCALLLCALAWHLGWKSTDLRAALSTAVVRSHVPRVETRAEWIRLAAGESRIDPNLLAAIMLSESGGRLDAVSSVDALGLFQLMLPTAVERARRLRLPEPSREDLLEDGLLNARLAADYMAWLQRRYDGHLERMLIAYNAGPTRLDRWIREAGGYYAWRAEREAAGNSDVLRYAAKVARYRALFAERGNVAPPVDQPPAPEGAPGSAEPEAPVFGPTPRPEHDQATTLHSRSAP